MDKIELIKIIIKEFQTSNLPHIFLRDKHIPFDLDYIVAVIGARRAGKTFLVWEAVEKLIKKGMDITKFVYINFEDERVSDLKVKELDYILQAYRALFPDYDLKDTYFIFDEIQNIEKWEQFVRRIEEKISKHIFVTGSNSKLLSSDIATAIGGRSYVVELFPLSFKELLRFKELPQDVNSLYSPDIKAKVQNILDEYLIYGGLPPIIISKDYAKKELLNFYFDTVIYKDIIVRYKIKNVKPISFFLKQLVNSNTKEFSINKIYNTFKSLGYEISKDTLYEYLEYAQNVYFACVLNKYESSQRLMEQTTKKIYLLDTGLANSLNTTSFDNNGRLLENAIFINTYMKNKDLFFYKEQDFECDFILCNNGVPTKAIQVCYSISDELTRKREIKGLVKACKALGLKEGTIVTYQVDEETFEQDGIQINVLSAAKYLLSIE